MGNIRPTAKSSSGQNICSALLAAEHRRISLIKITITGHDEKLEISFFFHEGEGTSDQVAPAAGAVQIVGGMTFGFFLLFSSGGVKRDCV